MSAGEDRLQPHSLHGSILLQQQSTGPRGLLIHSFLFFILLLHGDRGFVYKSLQGHLLWCSFFFFSFSPIPPKDFHLFPFLSSNSSREALICLLEAYFHGENGMCSSETFQKSPTLHNCRISDELWMLEDLFLLSNLISITSSPNYKSLDF